MIIIIRGHIRNSFENDNLYYLIKNIYQLDVNVSIYIHTWNIFSNNISWRKIDTNNNIVTNDIIYSYFKDLSKLIKKIIIDDDKDIQLIGNLSGTVCKSKMPLIGWKNYWYGKHKILNELNNKTEMVINMRFDVLNNSHSMKPRKIIHCIQTNMGKQITKNVFLYDFIFCGIDNCYIGNVYTMRILTDYFYYFLDSILIKNKNVYHQEHLIHIINEELFGSVKMNLFLF